MASLSWQLARRYRHTRHTSAFIRFIAASSTLGIGLGVAILILALSVMNGFERALEQKLLNVVPHVELQSVDRPIQGWPAKLQAMARTPGVVAAAPYIKTDGLLRSGSQVKATAVRGMDLVYEQGISQFDTFVRAGKVAELSEHEMIIGEGLANQLQVKVGDSVQLMLPQITEQGELSGQKNVNLTITAIVGIGGQLDYQQIWVQLEALAAWMDMPEGSIQGYAFKIDDIFAASNMARELGNQCPDRVYLLDWFRSQGHLYQDIQMVRSILYLVLALVIAVAAFNIVATLVMAVREKESDIAILLTMGTSPRDIVSAFVWLGWLSGVKGTAVGTAVGLLLAWKIEPIYQFVVSSFGLTLLDPTIYFIDTLPSEIHAADVVLTVAVALGLSLLATLYPSLRAAKVEPARVLGQK